MTPLRTLVASIPVALLVAACSSAPETTATSESDLRGVGGDLGDWTIRDRGHPGVTWPVRGAKYCPNVQPKCSVSLYTTPDSRLQGFNCTHDLYYLTGESAGVLGGIVAVCEDTADLRAKFGLAVHTNFCDACLPHLPCGLAYVVLSEFVGPNCPNGCPLGSLGGVDY